MASIKSLKKDIDYLTFSVVADCFNYSFIAGKNDEQLGEIIQNIIDSRNDLRKRVVGGRKLAKKEKAAYYKSIFKDLFITVDSSFTKLSQMVKKA